jgi:hypothetical protein
VTGETVRLSWILEELEAERFLRGELGPSAEEVVSKAAIAWPTFCIARPSSSNTPGPNTARISDAFAEPSTLRTTSETEALFISRGLVSGLKTCAAGSAARPSQNWPPTGMRLVEPSSSVASSKWNEGMKPT